jgi:hypothetical protein
VNEPRTVAATMRSTIFASGPDVFLSGASQYREARHGLFAVEDTG